jgi:hypothetical protein
LARSVLDKSGYFLFEKFNFIVWDIDTKFEINVNQCLFGAFEIDDSTAGEGPV